MPHPDGTQTYIRAAESTENIPSSRRVRDVAKRILYLDPDAAPLTLVLAKARTRVVTNSKYEWMEKDLPARWDAINNGAGYSDAATDVVVDNGDKFLVGDVVNIVRTGEKVRVTAVDTATETLTIVRSVGSTAAAAIIDNDALQIIGNSQSEGGTSPTPKSHQETYPFNYTQIVKTAFEVTGTESVSENYTGPDRPRLRAEKAIEHKIDLERTAIFGEREIDTSSTNNPIRYTGGFLFYADENVKDFGGTLTEPEMETWSEDLFHHTAGSDTRLLLSAATPISVINQLAVARIQMVPKEKTFGLSISQWITAHGTFLIAKHRLLENSPVGDTTQGYGGYMLALEPSRLAYCPLRERNTKLLVDVQANDQDTMKDMYMTECGWALENPRLHGVGKNITA